MDTPWWTAYIPILWQTLTGVALAQTLKAVLLQRGCRISGPYTAALTMITTIAIMTASNTTGGMALGPAISRAIDFGGAAPLLWSVFRWLLPRVAPSYMPYVGEERRDGPRDEAIEWTDEERQEHLARVDPEDSGVFKFGAGNGVLGFAKRKRSGERK